METVVQWLTGLIALEHLYILWMEMFSWEKAGKRAFGKSLAPELFPPTRKLAANQGLYNGFLAAGLIWSLCIADPGWQFRVGVFFLSCVSVAGIYGGLTASRKIFFIQALPALVTLVLLILIRGA